VYAQTSCSHLTFSEKVPTVFVHQLVNDKYQSHAFKGNERIQSPTFSELELTVEQIVKASGISKL